METIIAFSILVGIFWLVWKVISKVLGFGRRAGRGPRLSGRQELAEAQREEQQALMQVQYDGQRAVEAARQAASTRREQAVASAQQIIRTENGRWL